MSKKFEIIKKKNLPDDAQIKGFTFLKEPSKEDKDNGKFDFTEYSNGNEIGCMLSKRKTRVPILLIVLLGLCLVLVLCLRSCGSTPTDNPIKNNPIFDLTQDGNAQEGQIEGRPVEEIQEELNRMVEEGMINISMNLNPVFKDGTSEGNVLIMNEEINRHPQVIEIYRKDTEELIYKSGLIPVGSRVETGKLLVDLDAGEYPCVAYFNSVDENTGELLGKAGAEITIVVQE